ncbi:MAG: SMC-Scp complex subunit ScpB [Bdellovibrionales bacterium]|nr:SMC-Scp complex subunit ScpB [Bdellovibrionales bacterium]
MSNDNPHDKNETDELVTLMPGSSVIDIGELRRAQSREDSDDTDLDQEARSMMEEFENDPEMKKDVLEAFNADESDENLDRIADAVGVQEREDVAKMEELSLEVASELRAMNDIFIAEDRILEDENLRNELLGEETSEDEVLAEDMSEEDAALKAALPKADENGNYDLEDLASCIDTLLFYTDKPISLKKIKDMLEMGDAEDAPLLQAIENLKLSFQSSNRGFEIAEIAGGYQFRTKPSKAPLLRKLAKVQIQRLSRGAMETLTICAYKQPCTKDDIDSVRGVDSSHFIRTLLDRKLIEVSGRSEAPGRPMIYSTTDTFLEVFGLMDLGGLPPLREIEAMVPQMAASEEGAEDPRVLQMRKMVSQMKTEANHLDYDSKEDERILQDIKDRVKSIDISTPYLERQKQLAAEGITGEDAEIILAKEFGFDAATSGGEIIAEVTTSESEEQLSLEELEQIAKLNAERSLDTEIKPE